MDQPRSSAQTKAAPPALRTYAVAWVTDRDLEDRSREHYAQLLRGHVHVNLDGFVDAGDVHQVMIEPNVSWS